MRGLTIGGIGRWVQQRKEYRPASVPAQPEISNPFLQTFPGLFPRDEPLRHVTEASGMPIWIAARSFDLLPESDLTAVQGKIRFDQLADRLKQIADRLVVTFQPALQFG